MPRPTLRRALRYIAWGTLVLVLLLVVAVAGLAFAGGRRFATEFDAPAHRLVIATDSADIAEGGRLAAFWGCVGCHESDGGGSVFFESPVGDRLVAPNLTRIVREYSPAQLERAIRHGQRPDGRSVVVMPSSMYAHMSDEDLGKVVGYLRSLPAVADTLPDRRLGLMARFFALTEEDVLEAASATRVGVHDPSPDSLHSGSPRGDTLALGRYLALTGCPECHGPDLRGGEEIPDLRIAAAYSPEQFTRLIEEGIGLDGQEKGLMSGIARYRIGRLSGAERAALHAYLRTLAD